MIAFLHTSEIHISKFEKLVRKYNQDIEIKHFVNSELLRSALDNGETDTATFISEIDGIKKLKPQLIICTCSTYGEECDKLSYVNRIDEPIASYLVDNYKNIGLAFTAKSTQMVSESLLLRLSKEKGKGKDINIVSCDCTLAWKYYEKNEFEEYAKSIAKTIIASESKVDVVFLAQASMEGAMDYLEDFSKEIFSSPEFGVKNYIGN